MTCFYFQPFTNLKCISSKKLLKNRHLPSKSSLREKYFIFAFVSNTPPQKFNLHVNKYILTFLIQFKIINNGKCTEWSAIWAEIIRMISKSNERAARVRFEITSMISDQNCTTQGSITTLLHPF